MQFSEAWLKEWLNIPALDIETLTQKLTILGFEVDNCQKIAPYFNQVVIGEIMEASQHPNADRLKVCTVKIGQAIALTIVCGAPNARAGIKVPVALPGAQLPQGLTIKKTQLRGVESEGMICSAKELGIEDESNGIMELNSRAPVGINVREYLNLDDHVIDVSMTPNRGDCLSIQGLARELAAAYASSLTTPVIQPVPAQTVDVFEAEIQVPKDCPRYAYRVIRNINSEAKTPMWMQERLKRSGIRSIHPVVDITNYVMLELGQPMHAFNLKHLEKGVFVRHAKEQETLALLDGKTIQLQPGTLVISDHKKVQALAGVMGGSEAMVNEKTSDILLESAFFHPLAIRRSVQAYHLSSDSSQRFERGVDVELNALALERATDLILSIVGGEAGPLKVQQTTQYIEHPPIVLLRKNQIKRILGFSVPDKTVKEILSSLNITYETADEGWQVRAPSYRFDLNIEADFIEEVARLYGYDHIPTEKTVSYAFSAFPTFPSIDHLKIRNMLADRGYHEMISYSFLSKEYHQLFTPEQEMIILENPISQDLSVMRASLLPGLVKAFLYNQNRQQDRVRLFEIGVCFTKENQVLMQREKIAGLISGPYLPEQWAETRTEKGRPVDFYDVKGDLESLLWSLHCQPLEFFSSSLVSALPAVLHPGQSASLVWNHQILGYLGALHPCVSNALKITSPLFLFELDVALIGHLLQKKSFEPPSKFPTIRRDVSLIVDKQLPWNILKEKISNFANQSLSTVKLFDIYEGKPIAPDKKSVSIALTFQSKTQTLIETEVNQQMEEFLEFLKRTINMTLRD